MKDTKMNRDKNWNKHERHKKLNIISSETLIRNYDNGFNDGIRKAIEILEKNLDLERELLEKELID